MPPSAAPVADLAAVALDALDDGVLIEAGGEVVLANRALHTMAGDLVGRPVPRWLRDAAADARPTLLPDGSDAEIITLRNHVVQSEREAELLRLAHLDGLTGLLNQRTFAARLHEEADRLAALGRPLGLVVLDLDHFKAVNDEHGHPAGDRVLAEAARRLSAEARAIDAVGRIGGEEFAWLLPDATPAESLAAAHRLRRAIRSAAFGGGLRITASFGVCDLDAASGAETLLERADLALYWAKANGRDAVLRWTPAVAAALGRATVPAATGADRLAELARVTDAADPTPDGGHGRRVAALAVALAAALDWPPLRQARLHQAARLHDLGKAAIDPELLGRPGPLRTLERDHVGQHAALGASLTEGVLDAEQRRWIRHHHDRWDAGGERIPDGARLIALADAWDAMTSGRPYRRARTVEEALAEVDRCAGSQLEPDAGRLLRAARSWWRAES